jgi:hypothetical protein
MRGLAVMWALGAAACFSPSPQPGGACADGGRCPDPLVCDPAANICVLAPGDVPDAGPGDPDACVGTDEVCDGADNNCDRQIDEGFGVGDACTVGVGACAAAGVQVCNSAQTGVDCMATAGGPDPEVCGDGVDQDCDELDPPCPANDRPDGAIDISAGGTFTAELAAAHDDLGGSCGTAGGRDVFYEYTAPSPEVVYIDSDGSDFDAVLRVYAGTCDALGEELACFDDECVAQAMGAGEVEGTFCLVVDQGIGAAETHGLAVVNVIRGRRPGRAITEPSGSLTGTTDGEDNLSVPVCEGDSNGAPDVGYFLPVCAGDTIEIDANTCTNTPYDSWLSVRRNNGRFGNELACLDDTDGCGPDDDDASISATFTGPGLLWLLVDGYEDQAGAYRIDYVIQ